MDDEPPFDEDGNGDDSDDDHCEVPTDVLVDFLLSGGESIPDGYILDDDGNLCADSAAAGEQYGEEVEEESESEGEEDAENTNNALEEVAEESGRGKRRRVANKYYSNKQFWKH